MVDRELITSVRQKYEALESIMDERMRRWWAATEAASLGWGGITAVAQATGLSRPTIQAGLAELKTSPNSLSDPTPAQGRIRRPGGGRHCLQETDQTLLQNLEALVEPTTCGDPQSPLRWTCKSPRNRAEALVSQGHRVSHHTVARLLLGMDYSLQANRKTLERASHPDRNAQFEYIDHRVRSFQDRGQPVISIDTKKKELVGNFQNSGGEWRPKHQPEKVLSKDFKDKQLGKVAPDGVSDLTANDGWVSVGIDHDTARFATESVKRWWSRMGSKVYPQAKELLITADSGGSNGSRLRLWKVALQELADAIGLSLSVCHFPPGTSKWNTIEHRMFCHITENWRGKPLVSRAVIVNLIGNTKTRTGLYIKAALDENDYPIGIKVTDEQLAAVRISRDEFHGEWNYTIEPKQ
jgi:hypothetical protein